MDPDDDVPDSGAAFTFGKSRFASNLPGKFWVKDDPILQIACGDEHTALLTASGRVFTFGNNDWGQLGHGHTNALCKPSCVKGLKHERATVLACGRSHTLVATDTGHVYGFGTNSEGQLGSPTEYLTHASPVRVQGLEDVAIKMLSGGADHSMALTDKGCVYVWGSGGEGQLGFEKSQCLVPTEVKFDVEVMCISAGYYHSAFITVDGKLYMCGESDGGKLGFRQLDSKKSAVPHPVSGINGKVMYVSCGGNHTIALTADGRVFGFGNGFSGQLGLGDRVVEAYSPQLVTSLEKVKVARVSCGENHTAFLTDAGHLYTCGDRRHGKLGLLDDNDEICANQFFPVFVKRFQNFQVQQVSSGGCHMLVLAVVIPSRNDSTDIACPTRKGRRKEKEKKKLPPIEKSPSSQTPHKSSGSTSSLKSPNRPRLPSITKSPVWYVPLEKVAFPDPNSDEDEVLSKFEQRCSLLEDLEYDESIRHVDSDVETDPVEIPELNKTCILKNIDTSIVRPVISDEQNCVSEQHMQSDTKEPNMQEPISKNTVVTSGSLCDQISPAPLPNNDVSGDSLHNQKNEGKFNSIKKGEAKKSQFYDSENGDKESSTSTISKSSKACTVI